MKRNPEMGETAIQPVPAQTADLSISGLRFMSPLCMACYVVARLTYLPFGCGQGDLAWLTDRISDIIALSPHRERTDGGTEIAVMLCEKDNLAGAPEPPSSPPPLRLLPVRTERASEQEKRAKTQSRRLKTILMTQDQLLLPPPWKQKKETISLSLLRFFRMSFP